MPHAVVHAVVAAPQTKPCAKAVSTERTSRNGQLDLDHSSSRGGGLLKGLLSQNHCDNISQDEHALHKADHDHHS